MGQNWGGAEILGHRATFSLGWLNNLPGLGGYCSMVPVLNKISVIYNKEVHVISMLIFSTDCI